MNPPESELCYGLTLTDTYYNGAQPDNNYCKKVLKLAKD